MTLSSREAEFMALTMTSSQALWLRNLLRKVIESELKFVALYVENKSTIS